MKTYLSVFVPFFILMKLLKANQRQLKWQVTLDLVNTAGKRYIVGATLLIETAMAGRKILVNFLAKAYRGKNENARNKDQRQFRNRNMINLKLRIKAVLNFQSYAKLWGNL